MLTHASMNVTAVSAADDRLRNPFHPAFETIRYTIVSALPLIAKTNSPSPTQRQRRRMQSWLQLLQKNSSVTTAAAIN
jgi:hypothetical protein